jgi:hypothetical protein
MRCDLPPPIAARAANVEPYHALHRHTILVLKDGTAAGDAGKAEGEDISAGMARRVVVSDRSITIGSQSNQIGESI